jgi:membrane-bound ClpP family serine protease
MAAADPAPQQSQQPVYVVLVTGKVKPGMMPVFKEAFQPLAGEQGSHLILQIHTSEHSTSHQALINSCL